MIMSAPAIKFLSGLRVACAILSVAIGAMAMYAWEFRISSLIQMAPDIAPIRFNTALCIFFTGLAIISCNITQSRIITLFLALPAILVASISGFQYILGRKFGIDDLFVDPYIITKTLHPGRMSPNASLCMTLLPVSILLWRVIKNYSTRIALCIPAASIPFLLSASALVGYAFDIEAAYSWWSLSSMSPPAATGILLLSISILCLILSPHDGMDQSHKGRSLWIPAMIAATGVSLSFLLSQNILIALRQNIEAMAADDLNRTTQIIKFELTEDIHALERMVDRLNSAQSMSLSDWQRDAQNYIDHNSSYNSFILIGKDKVVADAVYAPGKNSVIPESVFLNFSSLQFVPDKPFHIMKSEDTPVLFFVFPVLRQAFDGYLVVNYDLGLRMSTIPHRGNGDKSYLTVRDLDSGVIFSDPNASTFPWQIEYSERIDLGSATWIVHQVTDASKYRKSILAVLVLGSGVALSLMLSYLAQQNHLISAYAQEIKSSEERYSFALDSADVGTWDWDIPQRKIAWGGAAWKILGAKNNQYLSEHYETLRQDIFGNAMQILRERALGLMNENSDFVMDFPMQTLDSRHIWVQARGRAIYYQNGRPVRATGTVTDITQQKKSENELLRSNQELEKFAYIASHDLKAPLRGIDNLAKWVQEDSAPHLPPASQDKLSLLRERVKRLETLLQDILEYSRAGRVAGNIAEIDTHDLVAQIIQSHVPAEFNVRVKNKLPVILTPQTPFEQVLGNILTNAVKHHDLGKGVIEVESLDVGNFYEFIVRDDGPGIPSEYHDRVFQMFQTLQSRDKVAGSGLGLSIIKKLVEWQGGRVWIVSDAGKRGTAIHFLWPKQPVRG